MKLSAKRLGEKFGMTSEEMNYYLKELGYLFGEPNSYAPTKKADGYVQETGADNGYGGYTFRGWNWLQWDESIIKNFNLTNEKVNDIKQKTKEQRRLRRKEKEIESETYWNNIHSQNSKTIYQDSTDDFGTLFNGLIGIAVITIPVVIHYFTKEESD